VHKTESVLIDGHARSEARSVFHRVAPVSWTIVVLERGTARSPCVAKRRCLRLTDADTERDHIGKIGWYLILPYRVDTCRPTQTHTHFILN